MASDFELTRQRSEELQMRTRELLREDHEARTRLRDSFHKTQQIIEAVDKVQPSLTTLTPHRPG